MMYAAETKAVSSKKEKVEIKIGRESIEEIERRKMASPRGFEPLLPP
jgi:hypothetical protein